MRKKQPEPPKTHTTRHLVIPVFFNESSDLTGWCEGVPVAGRVIAVKSVLYSDGSAKRWYKVEAVKLNRKKHKLKRRERVSKNGKQQRQQA
jgi:hypothetical protein